MKKPAECTVLIVDDEPDILELLVEEFEYVGFKSTGATCGNDAAEIIASEKIDIVVSDFKMPNGNGMVVLNAVNALPEDKRPSFYFVSGEADVGIQACLDAGAKKFYTKPFDLEGLIREVALESGIELPDEL